MNRRNKAVVIRFTEDEWKALNDKVKMAKLPREKFCRLTLLGSKVNAAPDADYVSLVNEVRRIGININQLARIAHQFPEVMSPDKLDYALEENHKVSSLLIETFRKVAK